MKSSGEDRPRTYTNGHPLFFLLNYLPGCPTLMRVRGIVGHAKTVKIGLVSQRDGSHSCVP